MASSSDVKADISFVGNPNDLGSVAGLASEIAALGAGSLADDDARLELLKKARSLVRALETPRETMLKHVWAQPVCTSALGIGVQVGLFELMSKKDAPKKVSELASKLGMETDLLARLLRHVAAMGYIKEVGEDEYEPTNFSNSLAVTIIGDGYPCILGSCFPTWGYMPQYFAKNGYKLPTGAFDGPFQHAYKTDMNFFRYLQANEPLATQFSHHMGGCHQGQTVWMDHGFFPVQERLLNGADDGDDAVLLVDVGGSIGHDLESFRRRFPDHPGRLVLQDLPAVIDTIKDLDPKVERIPHDFYTDQPVRGARAYYLHSVLHDWRDEDCDRILSKLTAAMKPGYSKLLVNENVIPSRNADWQATSLDLIMLSNHSAKERTEGDWRRLMERNGLKVLNIWSKGEGQESLIECELA